MNYFILVVSALLATGKALLCKALGFGGRSAKETIVLNCESFFVAFACSLIFVSNRIDELFSISSFSVMLSVFFGLLVAATQIMQTKAMGSGPASMVTLIYSCGFLAPIFYGVFFWDESVSVIQWGGIILLIIALCLMLGEKEEKGTLAMWLPFASAAMLGSGINAIIQKTHQCSAFAKELPFFLVYSMFFSAIFTAVVFLIFCEKKTDKPRLSEKQLLKNILMSICLGICVGALNFFNLELSGKLPSVIHFPVYNVGSMLFTSVISVAIYKDKPTKKQSIGFLIGIAAILVIGLL